MAESIADSDHIYSSTSHIGRAPPRRPYSIFSTPDNENTAEKTKKMAVRGLAGGTYIAICEMIAFSKPTTPVTMLTRFSTVCFPIAAMAVSYPAVVCISANVRNKDGPFNHFVGGFVAGTMLGTQMRSHKLAWTFGIGLGCVGVFYKYASLEGVDLSPHLSYKSMGSFNHFRHSLIPGAKYRRLETTDSLDQ